MVNPFSTRFFRPGKIPFFDTPECQFVEVQASVEENRGWGQIIGPHGAGKSTLLQQLVRTMRSAGHSVLHYTFASQPRPTRVVADLRSRLANERSVAGQVPERFLAKDGERSLRVVMDGFEQLSWWQKHQVRRQCKKATAGLLVTVHRAVRWLPVVADLSLSSEMAERVVAYLVKDEAFVSQLDLPQLLHRHNHNMREVLFDLYDRYDEQHVKRKLHAS